MKTDIVRRYIGNPILTKAQIPYPVETVHNAAVVKHGDEYIMLFRSHLRTGRLIVGSARSPHGFHFTADPEPFLTPARDAPFAAYEEFGVEHPRVTLLDGEYLIAYSAYSRNGVRIALAKTKDFDRVERFSLYHGSGLPECGDFPREVWRSLYPAGPSAFGDLAVVDLDFLFAGFALFGRLSDRHEAGTIIIGTK